MIDRNGRATDVLDLALQGLRDRAIPEGPSPELMAATIVSLSKTSDAAEVPPFDPRKDALAQSERQPARTGPIPFSERRSRMFRIYRYSGLAAAVAFLVVLAGWLFLLDRTAPLAFGDVVQNVKNAKSVSFVTEMPTIIQGSRRGILRQQFYMNDDCYRMEIPSAQDGVQVPPDVPTVVAILIADARQKKALLLDNVNKTAKYIVADEKMWQEMASSLADPVKQLRQLKQGDAERIGDEELDGVKAQVYRLRGKNLFMGMTASKDDVVKLWVDPRSGLPIRLAVGDPKNLDKPFSVFKDFRWNEPLAPDLFKLEVPKGFTVKDN